MNPGPGALGRGSAARRIGQALLLAPIRFYRYVISPWLGPSCRFTPSCSLYAQQAIVEHGPMRGSYLAARRLCRCHPWHPGGHDPVPPRHGATSTGSGGD